MARPRNPNRDKARELWEADKNRSLASIAAELGLPESRIRKWKSEDKWERSDKGAFRNAVKERSDSKNLDTKLVAMVEENPKLTDEQRLFCLYYVKSYNATRAYQRAYGCSYETAASNAWRMMENEGVRNEIKRLKAARNEAMLMDAEDIVALHWRIAFASLDDFVEWGRVEVPVMAIYGPVKVKNPETGEEEPLMREVNDVRFRESSEVDGQLVQEVKLGRDGASIKLADRQRSLAFLERYFELNPMDRHKKAFDMAKLELERKRSSAETDEGDLNRLLEAVKNVE